MAAVGEVAVAASRATGWRLTAATAQLEENSALQSTRGGGSGLEGGLTLLICGLTGISISPPGIQGSLYLCAPVPNLGNLISSSCPA